MGILSDPVFLSRFQFALTVIFHFLFVPLSIGLGLFMALAQTRAHKTKDSRDVAIAQLWVKIFTLTFTVGVASGITMEFSFGTNWADYSRFVGDIFGSPLAAEALFAFFLESSFLGVLLFGRKKVSSRFYMVSAWLVWAGSCLSALWIIIANSWMQTPAGYTVVDTAAGQKAIITDFFAAAFNPQTIPTYLHTVIALIIMGAFVALAIASYYHLHDRDEHFTQVTVRSAVVVLIVACVAMMPAAHMQAEVVANDQPTKLAAMEGHYETGSVPLYLFGYVDTQAQQVIGPAIEGITSFLASGSFDTQYLGLNEIEAQEPGSTPTASEIQVTFQSYHLMVAMMGLIALGVIAALLITLRDKLKCGEKLARTKWVWHVFMYLWIVPFLAIEAGWCTAEVGRQPWIVTGELKTADAISLAVPAEQLLITIVLFIVVYALVFWAWLHLFRRFIKEGPKLSVDAHVSDTGTAAASPSSNGSVVAKQDSLDDAEGSGDQS